MKPTKRVTIYDIAKRLNLTASSVSRALNNSNYINEKTKQLVIKTAAEMNYQHNSLASNLRKGTTQTIGVVVPRINQNFFSNVIAGIEESTYMRGYNLIICQSNEQLEREIQCVNTLINQHVNCIVISVSADSNNHAHLQNVINRGIGLIQFDRVVDELPTHKIINDTEQISFDAVSHLIAQGYRRIALLEGPQLINIFRQRREGYVKALIQHGLPIDESLIVANTWTHEHGAQAIRKLLDMPHPPDAIFASRDDFSALLALEVATAMGIKVPAQLGICGYSNEAFTEITNPSITTIDQHSVTIGQTIAGLYFADIEKSAETTVPRIISIKPDLIIRNSTNRKNV